MIGCRAWARVDEFTIANNPRYAALLIDRVAAAVVEARPATQRVAKSMAARIIAGGRLYVNSRNGGVASEASCASSLALPKIGSGGGAGKGAQADTAGGDRDIMVRAAAPPTGGASCIYTPMVVCARTKILQGWPKL